MVCTAQVETSSTNVDLHEENPNRHLLGSEGRDDFVASLLAGSRSVDEVRLPCNIQCSRHLVQHVVEVTKDDDFFIRRNTSENFEQLD